MKQTEVTRGRGFSRRRLLAGLAIAAGGAASGSLWAASEEPAPPRETGLSSEGLLVGQPGFQPRTVAPLPHAELPGFLTQAQLAANRSEFYRALPSGPFYGYNRPGAKPSEAVIENWWRQGMMGGAKAHYDGIVAFSQTDFTEDLKKITVPVLVMHGDDDQIVPYEDSAPLSAKLLKNGTLKTYKGFPHGMPTTEADTINADLLTFIRAETTSAMRSAPAADAVGSRQ